MLEITLSPEMLDAIIKEHVSSIFVLGEVENISIKCYRISKKGESEKVGAKVSVNLK